MLITSSLEQVLTPTVVALGNFDGVHRGHRQVIDPILAVQQPGQQVTVVTFSPHPQEFFSGQRRQSLTPVGEKADYLKTIGVQQLVLLPFDQTLAEMSPVEFVESILLRGLQACYISVGQDFRFGRQRSGTTDDLKAIATQHNIPVQIIPLYRCEGERISSSAIRRALQEGDLTRANQLLGRSYTLVGEVVEGQQLGRTIGFPTANLKLPPEKFLPCRGVYAVQVRWANAPSEAAPQLGVMNIGYRPTVDGFQQTLEVHLLDWSGDLYGQTLSVSLERFLRPEQKFPSLDALKAQIQIDVEMARSLLAPSPSL